MEITKPSGLTDHATLFMYKCTEITKNLGEFMNASLDLSNLSFAFLDEGFLVCEFMQGELRLQGLSLQLLGCSLLSFSQHLFLSY
jgi:hypothetical protein